MGTSSNRVEMSQFLRLPIHRQAIDIGLRERANKGAMPSRCCRIEPPRPSHHGQAVHLSRPPAEQLLSIEFLVRICSSAWPRCTSNSEHPTAFPAQAGVELS